jgi:hypothetical protein
MVNRNTKVNDSDQPFYSLDLGNNKSESKVSIRFSLIYRNQKPIEQAYIKKPSATPGCLFPAASFDTSAA